MRGCNCQEHRPHQSIYGMLNLNETASDAELLHAYEQELALLNKMQPTSEAEQTLLTMKRQELLCAMEKAKEAPLSQRIQNQYQKRKDHSVRLHSFFPVGFLGLILRLIDAVLGSEGLCDNILFRICNWLDTGCFRCSCCNDDCIFTETYGCLCSNTLCDCPTGCANCYENAHTVRLVDMGVTIAVAVGAVICMIKGRAEVLAYEANNRRNLAIARKDLSELKSLLAQQGELIRRFVDYHEKLKPFALDVRPFANFLAELPGASQNFIAVANRLSQPGSFYDQVEEDFEAMDKLHKEIVALNQQILQVAARIQKNEMYQRLDFDEHCHSTLDQAANGLRRNRDYHLAESFLNQNT